MHSFMILPDVPPFYAIEISRLAHQLQQTGHSILHMEFGQPSAGAPRAALEATRAVLGVDPMGYWSSQPLKERLARHYLETYGVTVDPHRILLTSGASGGLLLTFNALFQRGDRIAMTRPGYAPYRNALKALRLVPVEIPCGADTGFRLKPDQLAALDPAPKALILASPANPTGTMVSAEDMRAIMDICTAKNILLISDEIYHGLSYGAKAHSALEYSDQAIIINSFSKYYCMPGWRLGWMVMPDHLSEYLDNISGNLFLTPSSLAQHAALAAMDAQQELDKHVIAYTHNRTHIITALQKLGVTNIAPPDGAFYIYADVGHLTNDSLQFCKDLVRSSGVAIAPGIDFDPENGHRFIRFSFAVSEDECRDAMQRFAGFIQNRTS
jgi:aspartate/methionine/tyrosine aminotransferase